MKLKYRLLPIALFLIFICIFAIALNSPDSKGFKQGVSHVSLNQLLMRDGSEFTVKNNALLVVFSLSCLECKKNLQMLKEAQLEPIGIIFDSSYERDSLKNIGYKHILYPKNREYFADLGVSGVPETFVIDENGLIKYSVKGLLTNKDIDAISKL